jgi:hypothetical protein
LFEKKFPFNGNLETYKLSGNLNISFNENSRKDPKGPFQVSHLMGLPERTQKKERLTDPSIFNTPLSLFLAVILICG